jgi:hypothetical protein
MTANKSEQPEESGTFENSVRDVLGHYDNHIERLDELDVRGAIVALKPKDEGWKPPLAWVSEVIAFGFCEDYPWDRQQEGSWGTYFGPIAGGSDKDGRFIGSPDISQVSTDMLKYWAMRAAEARHPVLKARYAGLVWDFSQNVAGEKPEIRMAHFRIDAIVQVASENLYKYATYEAEMLEHALALACQINDPERIERVRDAILTFEDHVGEDEKPGLYGFAYDRLWHNKKALLTELHRTSIIRKMEDHLTRITGSEEQDPWTAEAVALRLAEHYRTKNDRGSIRRVLLMYGGAFEKMADQAAPMLAQAWLEDVCSKYRAFGLTQEADRLLRKIQELGPKVRDSLVPFGTEMTITKKEMDDYVDALVAGTLDDALARIAVQNLPRKDSIVAEIKKLEKTSPLMSLLPSKLVDHNGRPTAVVGGLKNDLEGHVIRHMTQNMQFSAIFLRQAMIGLRKKFSLQVDSLVAYARKSPLFPQEREAILSAGIEAYLNEQPLRCIHVLIPQIEAAIRTLVQETGGTVLRPNRMGGQDLRTFDVLLRDELVTKFLGEDIPLYFRVLFTDRRGINLRNDICHGICSGETFTLPMADRVVHAILILSLLRKKADPNTGEEENTA